MITPDRAGLKRQLSFVEQTALSVPARNKGASMANHRLQVSAAVAITLAYSLAHAADTKVKRSDLPVAVEKTVQEQSAGATIRNYLTEKEHGVLSYEVEMVVDGHTKDITISKDGTLVEVEEEVAMASLPDEVNAGLTAQAKGAKILKVESVVRGAKLVAYSAETLKGTKKGEVQVSTKGESRRLD